MATSSLNSAKTSPIHYGGSLTAKGNLSQMPRRGKRFAYLALIEKLVRLDLGMHNSGIVVPDGDIGRMIGRSARYVTVIRRSVDYLTMRIQIQTGISISSEATAKDIAEYRRAHFREMLPDALRVVADALLVQPKSLAERKLQTQIALEVMDREGTFPKISRTDVHAKVEHDYSSLDAVSAELLSVMDSPMQSEALPARLQGILDANRAFSNSETLTHDKQEAALASLETTNLPPNMIN